ncbi:MAG: hypothetical protein IJ242_09120 [Clostridia bacterium]|nr:hypothetical protein [Clostridia bacterium]
MNGERPERMPGQGNTVPTDVPDGQKREERRNSPVQQEQEREKGGPGANPGRNPK